MRTMDQTKANVQVAMQFFGLEDLPEGIDRFDFLTDDVRWEWMGHWPQGRLSTGKAGIKHAASVSREKFTHGMRYTLRSVVAEGDKVALELESNGALRDGEHYNNFYHFALQFRNGRICAAREYLDVHHVLERLGGVPIAAD
jgi:ketosteroid isomerase-like protein